MQHLRAGRKHSEFEVLAQTRSLQCATMILKPGGTSSDEKENEHPRAEQWLVVVLGTGKARVGSRSTKIGPGSVLLIEKNEPHQIINTGRGELRTINFYAPPAYDKKGKVLSKVK